MRSQIPNALCYLRIVLSGLFVLTYSNTDSNRFQLALAFIAVAFLTDPIDGRLARRWGVVSRRGSILDGLADRSMYLGLTFALVATRQIHAAIAWLLITREFLLYGVRLMRETEWYPVVGLDRRLALAHGLTLDLWLWSFIIADGVALSSQMNWYEIPAFVVFQWVLLFVVLVVAYVYLWKNLMVLVSEDSSSPKARKSQSCGAQS